MYRPTVRCLHRFPMCMIERCAAISLTVKNSTNYKGDIFIIKSEIV